MPGRFLRGRQGRFNLGFVRRGDSADSYAVGSRVVNLFPGFTAAQIIRQQWRRGPGPSAIITQDCGVFIQPVRVSQAGARRVSTLLAEQARG